MKKIYSLIAALTLIVSIATAQEVIKGSIDKNMTFKKGTDYLFDGLVYVDPGVTATFEGWCCN